MSHEIIRAVEAPQLKKQKFHLSVGDTVDVHVRIIEGAKERVQVFNGVIIKMQGSGLTRNITVRRIVANEGVERTFPLHSPNVAKVLVKRHGHVRRAKLYYLRERLGKKRRLRDRRRGLGNLIKDAASQAAGSQQPPPPPSADAPQPVEASPTPV